MVCWTWGPDGPRGHPEHHEGVGLSLGSFATVFWNHFLGPGLSVCSPGWSPSSRTTVVSSIRTSLGLPLLQDTGGGCGPRAPRTLRFPELRDQERARPQ